MPSIDDFVNHRFADAQAELGKLDQGYVSNIESTVRLENLGLKSPLLPDDEASLKQMLSPKQRLSKEWHRLLEACYEIALQESVLRTAVASLIADSHNTGMSKAEIGRRIIYCGRSWFIHATTLAERTDDVIRKTTDAYMSEPKTRRELCNLHCSYVFSRVTDPLKDQRVAYVHSLRSWARGITEDDLWEGYVALGWSPTITLDDFIYPARGEDAMSGKYHYFADLTRAVSDNLGEILHELEKALAHQKLN